MNTLTIDSEFKSLIPPLSQEERDELEASLKAEGCRDALVVWAGQGILLDGHNRYELCQQYGIEYRTTEREFDDRDDAKLWIINNQLARRNLSIYERGRLALIRKPLVAAAAEKRQLSTLKQGDTAPDDPNLDQRGRTLDELANHAQLSHGTIHKIETVERDAPEPIKQKARAGEISTHRAYNLTRALKDAAPDIVDVVAKWDVEDAEIVEDLKRLKKSQDKPDSNGTFDEIVKSGYIQPGDEEDAVHISDSPLKVREALKKKAGLHAEIARDQKDAVWLSSESNEWYTPAKYLEAARAVLGGIDLDPASSPKANETVKAEAIFTPSDDGLVKEWHGRVWLNPPYGGLSGPFVAKLVEEINAGRVSSAIVLVNANSTETKWFAPMWGYTLCFTDHRIDFVSPNGTKNGSTHGSVFIYLGPDVDAFAREFDQFGYVVRQLKYMEKDHRAWTPTTKAAA